MKGTIKMNTMAFYANKEDEILGLDPVFRVHIEITDIDFDRIGTIPKVSVEYKLKK